MPTVTRSRTIAAPAQSLWEIISDPYHLPRWWPRVIRVEDVEGDGFTEVMRTQQGKSVRADFDVVRRAPEQGVLAWDQRIPGSPFARVLKSARTEVRLSPPPILAGGAGGGGADGAHAEDGGDGGSGASRSSREHLTTEVTLELQQELASFSPRFGLLGGMSPRLGSFMVKRAAAKTLHEALDGLERISG